MADPFGNFRINFEQQQKRAKELLKAARGGEPRELARFAAPPKLAEAQHLIARELRFPSWTELKRHSAALAKERQALSGGAALDADLRTLHVRCGRDLQAPLQDAGLRGDFCEHSYPYLIGPVREGPGCIEQRARFLVDHYADSRQPPLAYEPVLRALERDEQFLHDAADYERVVVWSERDCYDQLVLLRVLAHFATGRRPPLLELINVEDFPGATRFIGLGQLPPEALRLLWRTRKATTPAQLRLGLDAWRALANDDPCDLAAIVHAGTPALPLLAPALHRHLRELPSAANGLSFTEEMALELLAERDLSLNRIFVELNQRLDPLPGQGDLQVRDRVLAMEGASAPVFTRRAGVDRNGVARPPWTDVLSITALGLAVLGGEVDFRSLRPPPRWVGGVEIRAGEPDWRWDEQRQHAVRRLSSAAS